MFFLLLMMLFIFFVVASSASRSMRRRQEEQRYREELAARQEDDGSGATVSPFAGMPFGSLFEQMFSMGSARSLAFDPETGQWVDITDREHLYQADPAPDGSTTPKDGAAPTTTKAPQRSTRPKRTTRPRSSSMANPLSGLFGSGGDGSGEFDVEPPEELGSFKDVGGMETLKQEVRDTIGLMLQHPEDAEERDTPIRPPRSRQDFFRAGHRR
jgi:SpoVK/Ycf46/Vps4 family AAA+-type ATPase